MKMKLVALTSDYPIPRFALRPDIASMLVLMQDRQHTACRQALVDTLEYYAPRVASILRGIVDGRSHIVHQPLAAQKTFQASSGRKLRIMGKSAGSPSGVSRRPYTQDKALRLPL